MSQEQPPSPPGDAEQEQPSTSKEADLPKSVLKRLIVAKLQEIERSRGGGGNPARSFQVSKDALLAFGEAAKLFIHYLTSHANDTCKDAKRLTISAQDVFAALVDLDFDEFVDPLKSSLDAFKSSKGEENNTGSTKKTKADADGGTGGGGSRRGRKKKKVEENGVTGAAVVLEEEKEAEEGKDGEEQAVMGDEDVIGNDDDKEEEEMDDG